MPPILTLTVICTDTNRLLVCHVIHILKVILFLLGYGLFGVYILFKKKCIFDDYTINFTSILIKFGLQNVDVIYNQTTATNHVCSDDRSHSSTIIVCQRVSPVTVYPVTVPPVTMSPVTQLVSPVTECMSLVTLCVSSDTEPYKPLRRKLSLHRISVPLKSANF